MAGHNNTLSVQVDLQTSTPPATSFGILMLACLTLESGFDDTVRTYTSQDDVDDDAADLGATAVAILTAIFSQSPHVTTVKVGALDDLTADVWTLTILTPGTVGQDWTVSLRGLTATYTVQGGDNAAAVATGLEAAIEALAGIGSGAVGAAITITGENLGEPLAASVTGIATNGTYTLVNTTPATTVADGLDTIEAEDSDFYGVLLDTRVEYSIIEAATWVSTRQKLGVFETNDAAVLANTAGHVGEDVTAENAVIVYHDDSSEYPAAAWASNRLYYSPDLYATVWHKCELEGITEVSATTLEADHVNWFDDFNGVGIMDPGQTANGTFIDLVILKHWLELRLAADLTALLTRATAQGKKIPYTQQGIDQVASVVAGRILRGVAIGHIEADTWEVTAPRITDVEPADRAARLLSLSFTAVPSGGIKNLTITGNVALPV